jgi:hypothetical protein
MEHPAEITVAVLAARLGQLSNPLLSRASRLLLIERL